MVAHTAVWNSLVWPGPDAPVNALLFTVANGLLLLYVATPRCPPAPVRPSGRHDRAGRPAGPGLSRGAGQVGVGAVQHLRESYAGLPKCSRNQSRAAPLAMSKSPV